MELLHSPVPLLLLNLWIGMYFGALVIPATMLETCETYLKFPLQF